MLTALAAEQPALLEWHLSRHKRALALCIAEIGRDPDDGFDDGGVRNPSTQISCLSQRWRQFVLRYPVWTAQYKHMLSIIGKC